MRRLVEQETAIGGPDGCLEALVSEAEDASAVAVICHPHPQHGGTMQNKVVHTLARTMAAVGLTTVRFNFRGVGKSEGSYGEGVGEVEDVRAVVEYARRAWPDLPVWLGGFSFGAMASIVAAAPAGVARLISVAPPVYRLEPADFAQPQCPWLILIGDADELVDVDAVVEWVNELEPGPELQVLEDVDHFFHGRLTQLKERLLAWIYEDDE